MIQEIKTEGNLNFICCNTVILLHLVPVYKLRAFGSASGSGNSMYPLNGDSEKMAAYTA